MTVNEHGADDKSAASRKYRLSWASLIARVFLADVETCPDCGGKMHVVAALTDQTSISRYLEGTGLSPDIPKVAPARASPQEELDFGY